MRIYGHLVRNVDSKMCYVEMISPARCLSGFSAPENGMARGNSMMSSVISTWFKRLTALTKENLTHLIVQDLFAPFTNVRVGRVDFGIFDTGSSACCIRN